MKKIIRLTESDLHRIIKQSVKRILREDVLGDNWHEKEETTPVVDNEKVLNNYEAFEDPMGKEHNWGVKGEEQFDPTHYDNFSDDIVNGR